MEKEIMVMMVKAIVLEFLHSDSLVDKIMDWIEMEHLSEDDSNMLVLQVNALIDELRKYVMCK